jgi:hypothetical protein
MKQEEQQSRPEFFYLLDAHTPYSSVPSIWRCFWACCCGKFRTFVHLDETTHIGRGGKKVKGKIRTILLQVYYNVTHIG